jgi:hypothetical protein
MYLTTDSVHEIVLDEFDTEIIVPAYSQWILAWYNEYSRGTSGHIPALNVAGSLERADDGLRASPENF